MLKSSNDTTRAHNQELESDSSGANAPSLKTPDGEVTTANPSEADTAAHLKKGPRSKKAKHPADKTAPEAQSFKALKLKLPFEFADEQFSEAVVVNMLTACPSASDLVDKASFKSMASVMLTQKPKDPFELMLMHQMVGIHGLTMQYLGHLSQAKNGAEIDLFERTLNKLARTFASQVDVLQRCCRSRGEQRLTVQQNVAVNNGGQAIVANVLPKVGGEPATAPAPIADNRTEPMTVIEADEQSVPVAIQRGRR